MTGVAAVPEAERERYDLINKIAQHIPYQLRRMDYIDAVALALDVFEQHPKDRGNGDRREVLAAHGGSRWHRLPGMNRQAAIEAYEILIAGEIEPIL
jgi:hypothetical protein